MVFIFCHGGEKNKMLSNFLKDDGENIIFTGHYMEIYVPETYFATKLAEIDGSLIKVFGLLECAVFDNKDKKLLQETLNLPTTIVLYFNDMYTAKLNLYPKIENVEPVTYRVLKFYKNNTIMSNVIQKDSTNVELFVNLMCAGKIKGIPYNKILTLWQKNLELNDVNLGVPSSVLEIIISEIYRNAKNPNEKFSKYSQKNPKDVYNYRASNIREICSRNSTFSALTFEDFDMMLTASLNMTKYDKKQVDSPIEQVIKM